MTVIYALLEPDTKQVRYIGKTNNLSNRYKSHLCAARGERYKHLPVNRWMRKLLQQDTKPLIKVLDSCLHWTWQEAERWWIAYCRSISVPLLNGSDGGESGFFGYSHSEKTKTKMSERKNLFRHEKT